VRNRWLAGDGLPARPSGWWTQEKLGYVERYASAFMVAMHPKRREGKWEQLVYIDLLLFFPSAIGIRRNLRQFVAQKQSPMDAFWGGKDWRELPPARLAAGKRLSATEVDPLACVSHERPVRVLAAPSPCPLPLWGRGNRNVSLSLGEGEGRGEGGVVFTHNPGWTGPGCRVSGKRWPGSASFSSPITQPGSTSAGTSRRSSLQVSEPCQGCDGAG